jgi:toxin-antitoxin system PIN domain toxin
VIAVDTNVLVYAHRSESAHNERCYGLMRQLASGPALWAIPSPCLAEFLCVVTHPRYLATPTPLLLALEQVRFWLTAPTCQVLAETHGTWDTLRDLVESGQLVGPRVYDARIAAISLDHSVHEIWTLDRDFSRFPKLRTRNPLLEDLS